VKILQESFRNELQKSSQSQNPNIKSMKQSKIWTTKHQNFHENWNIFHPQTTNFLPFHFSFHFHIPIEKVLLNVFYFFILINTHYWWVYVIFLHKYIHKQPHMCAWFTVCERKTSKKVDENLHSNKKSCFSMCDCFTHPEKWKEIFFYLRTERNWRKFYTHRHTREGIEWMCTLRLGRWRGDLMFWDEWKGLKLIEDIEGVWGFVSVSFKIVLYFNSKFCNFLKSIWNFLTEFRTSKVESNLVFWTNLKLF